MSMDEGGEAPPQWLNFEKVVLLDESGLRGC
jgi:hypothetical protein